MPIYWLTNIKVVEPVAYMHTYKTKLTIYIFASLSHNFALSLQRRNHSPHKDQAQLCLFVCVYLWPKSQNFGIAIKVAILNLQLLPPPPINTYKPSSASFSVPRHLLRPYELEKLFLLLNSIEAPTTAAEQSYAVLSVNVTYIYFLAWRLL